jgi:hypothetical protein
VKGTTKDNIKARINIALSCHCKNIEFVESWQIEASSSSFFFSLLLSHTCFSLSSILSLSLSHQRSNILFSSHPKVCCLSLFFFLFSFS